MAGRKRKVVALFECECESEDHDSKRECDEAAKSRLAKSITAKILPFSKIATVLVGPSKQPFYVLQDLLALHSAFFRHHFARADQRVVLPTIDVLLFAHFVTWLHLLELPGEPDDGIHDDVDDGHTAWDREWALGSFLGAPSYQNTRMQAYKNYCQGSWSYWPDIRSISTIYEITASKSKLRRFAADSMATQSPFKKHAPGSPEFDEWNALLLQYPELSLDVVHAGAREWNGSLPWDDENIDAYMEDETLLDVAWEEQILAKGGFDEIRKEAGKKCIRSIFELAHLGRNKDSK